MKADGDVYEGNFADDKANGYGIYKQKQFNPSTGKLEIISRFEGEWKDDK